ncbi:MULTISPECIES: Spx/MgsR family RNA polymerase-binding regulatory protein [Bacillaceae]|uniref:Spx/MgsR family RNA polymerase-binding regulatory protein n=1 Tax=Sutcliffiella horikoshii TaxID=79883 RepID=A0A5D4TJ67_9BACI|nr:MULTISPECIES: Spx/MgsR family RNA polymerase-binding regulatory protein [Bacillaceae]TYS74791.1 Spx/MgsR family RNA polymerase-binding regulatory protein [Sutcliffiella horikoshii]
MNEIIFYSYPSCTSCRKTKKWLNGHNIPFQEKHIFRETPNKEEMMKILSLTTEGIDEILATRSQTFKDLGIDVNELSLSQLIELIIEEPKLLRRPIITSGKKLIVGYNESALQKLSRQKPKLELKQSVS